MRRVLIAFAGALTLLGAACTPPPGGGSPPSGPVPPAIDSFVATSPSPAPALVGFSWSVADANGDSLTCRLDADGNGTFDFVVNGCQAGGARNWAFAAPTTVAAKLRVEDGTTAPVETTIAVQVTAGPSEGFAIALRPLSALDPTSQANFDAAVAKWQAVLARGVPDLALNLPGSSCLSGAAPFNGVVDDLVIDVAVRPIDGAGGILGQAGPCWLSSGDNLSRWGVMEFDSADVATMISGGYYDEVIVHEMGHVLGIGTLWNDGRAMLAGAGGSDPRFVGTRGVAEWNVLGGTGTVPVENSGGAGTRDAHWREATFNNELMTGYIDSGTNPLSAMSVASLADLGYLVDRSAADAYSLPGPSLRLPGGVELPELLRPPVRTAP